MPKTLKVAQIPINRPIWSHCLIEYLQYAKETHVGRGKITVQLTSCFTCVITAAFLMLNYQQINGAIATQLTCLDSAAFLILNYQQIDWIRPNMLIRGIITVHFGYLYSTTLLMLNYQQIDWFGFSCFAYVELPTDLLKGSKYLNNQQFICA